MLSKISTCLEPARLSLKTPVTLIFKAFINSMKLIRLSRFYAKVTNVFFFFVLKSRASTQFYFFDVYSANQLSLVWI